MHTNRSYWVFAGIEPGSSNSQFEVLPNKLKTPCVAHRASGSSRKVVHPGRQPGRGWLVYLPMGLFLSENISDLNKT